MLDAGIYGAKVQSWKKANPRDLLKRIVEDNPDLDKSALLSALRDEVLSVNGPEYLDSIIEYWFSNNYHSLAIAGRQTSSVSMRTVRARTEATAARIMENVQTRIREEAEMILLDMMLPSGKALRDATGRDCTEAGGWFLRIAEEVKPNQKVGAVLSEDHVRTLWKSR